MPRRVICRKHNILSLDGCSNKGDCHRKASSHRNKYTSKDQHEQIMLIETDDKSDTEEVLESNEYKYCLENMNAAFETEIGNALFQKQYMMRKPKENIHNSNYNNTQVISMCGDRSEVNNEPKWYDLRKYSQCEGKTKSHKDTGQNNIQTRKQYNINDVDFVPGADTATTEDEYFNRNLSLENLNLLKQPNDTSIIFRSPATCRTLFGTFSILRNYWIKGKDTTVKTILKYIEIQDENTWSLLISRLAPADYHRFHAPVQGNIKTIRDVAGDKLGDLPASIKSSSNVYSTNQRKIFEIKGTGYTEPIYMVIVGSNCSNSITVSVLEGNYIDFGDELGYFHSGGSTILTFIHNTDINNMVQHSWLTQLSKQIVVNGLWHKELYVEVGTVLFKKKNTK